LYTSKKAKRERETEKSDKERDREREREKLKGKHDLLGTPGMKCSFPEPCQTFQRSSKKKKKNVPACPPRSCHSLAEWT